ncbi:hypothetical protein NQ315_013348, partial [Exocentrus adspersus]
MPGEEWFYRFMNRNKAAVSRESIVEYFSNLRETLPDTNILNYDETNMSDDPGRVKVLCRKDSKRAERIMDS